MIRINIKKGGSITCSTISGCERHGVTRQFVQGFFKLENILFRFVEIDLVSCHVRVLCFLFPGKTFLKIVTYKTLQLGLVSHQSILKAIYTTFRLSVSDLFKVVELMRTNPLLLEFRTLFKEVEFRTLFKEVRRRANMNNLRGYSIFQKQPLEYRAPDNEATARGKQKFVFKGGRSGVQSKLLQILLSNFSRCRVIGIYRNCRRSQCRKARHPKRAIRHRTFEQSFFIDLK